MTANGSTSQDRQASADVRLLREIVDILRRGRVGDMVHHSWSERVEELADRWSSGETRP